MLLELFERYYIPLQGELRPVMRAFILALLPGLEEETSEFFERVRGLLILSIWCLSDEMVVRE